MRGVYRGGEKVEGKRGEREEELVGGAEVFGDWQWGGVGGLM